MTTNPLCFINASCDWRIHVAEYWSLCLWADQANGFTQEVSHAS